MLVALAFILKTLQFRLRDDRSLNLPNVEGLWIQIKCKMSDIILIVIYHHPYKEISFFQNKICNRISSLESKKSSCFFCGDINKNTLENTNKTLDYINALTSIGCKMTVRNPTRFANNYSPSLLNHVYTNISNKNTSNGVSMFEISDHLPIFFLLKQSKCDVKKYKRCMKNFILEEFLNELKNKLSSIAFEPYFC